MKYSGYEFELIQFFSEKYLFTESSHNEKLCR